MTGLLGAALLGGCVFVSSLSYTNVSLEQSRPVSVHDSELGFLHLSKPTLDRLIDELTVRLNNDCSGRLINIKTVLSVRDLLLIQAYDVQISAQCQWPVPPKE